MYMKKGIPEEGEIVLCRIRKILPHSVFADLIEYGNKEGMIHISEIAPGRIRNIREYVKEGKQVVCKVLQLNKERGTIDISLRRVSLQQRLKKEESFKQEQKSEKMLELAAQKLKTTLQDAYEKAGNKIIAEYGSLSECFHDIAANGKEVLDSLNLPAEYAKELAAIIKERIKPPEVKIVADIILESHDEKGVDVIKKALKAGEDVIRANNYRGALTYIGAPHYRLELVFNDYKSAEEGMEKVCNAVAAEIKKLGGAGSFKRVED